MSALFPDTPKAVSNTLKIAESCNVEFEFRTTVVKELHSAESIKALADDISGAKRYFLQNFVDSGDLIGENLSAHDKATLEEMKEICEKTIDIVEIRGI